ncbi:TonB-dependent receptor [Raineya orbicola]|uniref:TonB-dependent Receptor Plug Domain n=1 Tax=Raineya orbicola TaxID=2016530 RepID=A0A2N3I9U2_9BACT|nr:TonB-dependent receptor plug domain-containing protein [Raineya orbicola]PKQ67069.1 TonB-dependent Receptor Plug Domain [Raineya orbicola]
MKYRFLLALGFLLGELHAQCTASIHGHIYQKDTKISLSDVQVRIEPLGKILQTNAEGEFELLNICEGEYQIFLEKEDFLPLHIVVELKKNEHFHKDIFLQADNQAIASVEVLGSMEKPFSTQTQNFLIGQELELLRGKTLGEMLKSITGVFTFNTGAGISKPMIHGLHSQRITILNNGIRQEGQQWGEEHAPEIDVFSAEQVSVIKGAAGVRYGSDAMGGVVMLNPLPLPTEKKLHGKAYLIGHSNNRMGNLALQIEKAFGKGWAWRWQGSAKRGGDFHSPTYVLSNTGVQELNFATTLGIERKKWQAEAYLSRYDADIGILRAAHTGNINDLAVSISRPEPWYVAPFTYEIQNPRQKIVHYLAKISSKITLDHLGTLSLQYALQWNDRKEFDIRRGGRSTIPALSLQLQTHTFDAVLEHHAWKNFQGSLGASTLWQDNYNVPGTGITPLLPNFTNFSQGIFWVERFVKPTYELEWGLRYDFRHTEVRTFQNRVRITPNYQFHWGTATLGYLYRKWQNIVMKTNFATTFRPPHTAELFSQGLHLGIGNIQQGLLFENGSLNPDKNFALEKSYKWIGTIQYQKGAWQWEISPYHHWIDNFIYATPTDIRLTIQGYFPVFSYVQRDVVLRGIDAMQKFQRGNWQWQSKFSYLNAFVRKNNEAIINMPPLRWENRWAWERKNWGKLQNTSFFVSALYVARQNNAPRVIEPSRFENISSEEKEQILAEGTFDFMLAPAGYWLWGAGASSTFKNLTATLQVENLTNTIFRDYLNRWRYYANDVGRNFILQISYIF